MQGNGRLLALARKNLEEIREKNSAVQERRLREIYLKIPRIKNIDEQMSEQMRELFGLVLKRDDKIAEKIAQIEAANLLLQAERGRLLREAGYSSDYTDEIYSCSKCKDSGMCGTELCECLIKLRNNEITKELGTLIRSGDESFDNFDLSYYNGNSDDDSLLSDRDHMSLVLETCREYAMGFGKGSANLIFMGDTGLGKTFLSACIARDVAKTGFSVAYDSVQTALNSFETKRFARDPAEASEAEMKVSSYLDCDLLILDDLGTEMITSFSIAALYQIINTRLIGEKPTIISTNYSFSELEAKYNPQILSRIEGEYLSLPFRGQDIRKIKKML